MMSAADEARDARGMYIPVGEAGDNEAGESDPAADFRILNSFRKERDKIGYLLRTHTPGAESLWMDTVVLTPTAMDEYSGSMPVRAVEAFLITTEKLTGPSFSPKALITQQLYWIGLASARAVTIKSTRRAINHMLQVLDGISATELCNL